MQLLRSLLKSVLCFVAYGGILLTTVGALSAQEAWPVVSSPTTQDLWGVCYGPNQFVAVGKGGVILTSTDGATWTQRVSGSTQWLTGVAFGDNVYVVVGDNGTILTSSDAVTWTVRSTDGRRLNNVAYGNGRFLSVGENGEVRTSTDGGVSWTITNIGEDSWLRGLVFARGSFLVGGKGGALRSTPDGVTFTRIGVTTHDVEVLAFGDGCYLAAGADGLLAVSRDARDWESRFAPTTALAPQANPPYFRAAAVINRMLVAADGNSGYVIVHSNPDTIASASVLSSASSGNNAIAVGPLVSVMVGNGGSIRRQSFPPTLPAVGAIVISSPAYVQGSASLRVPVSGSGPLTYQWLRDGVPINGATTDVLTLSAMRLADAGTYTFTATNVLGSVTSAPASLSVLVSPPSVGLVDPIFRVALADAIEPYTNVNEGPPSSAPTVVTVQPDGRILVGGRFFSTAPDGTPCYGIARLNADGSGDSTFRAGLGVSGGEVSDIALQSDGRILVAGTFTRFDGVSAPGLVRLAANGSRDFTFTPSQAVPSSGQKVIALTNGRVLLITPSTRFTVRRLLANGTEDSTYNTYVSSHPAGGTYTVARYLDGSTLLADSRGPDFVAASNLVRFFPDGERDFSFNAPAVSATVQALAVLADGKIMYAGVAHPDALHASATFGRLNADGTPDQTYKTQSYIGLSPGVLPLVAPGFLSDGRVLLFSRDAATPLKLFQADGTENRSFRGRLDGDANAITALTPLPDGNVLALGAFIQLNGVPTRRIARLITTPPYGSARLANLSVRSTAGSGDQTLITGFVLSGGNASRSILVRGVGPTLADFGVSGALADPEIILHSGAGVISSNDSWSESLSPLFNRLGAFSLRSASHDAALSVELNAGVYSVHLSSKDGSSGNALAEIYDAATSSTQPRLVNVSARTELRNSKDVLIAGFVITGEGSERVLVRAVGPTLTDYGVTRALTDPTLTLYQGQNAIVVSNDWAPNTVIDTTAKEVGAFALRTASKDAALLVDLPPGVYSAAISSSDGSTGTVLVEIYEVP